MLVERRCPNDPPGVISKQIGIERILRPLRRVPWVCDWRHFGSARWLDHLTPDDFDVVHLHNIHGEWISINALSALSRRIPTVWTLHDEWAPSGGFPYDLRSVLPDKLLRTLKGSRTHPIRDGLRFRAWTRLFDRYMPTPKVVVSPSEWLLDRAQACGRFECSQFKRLANGLPLLGNPLCSITEQDARAYWKIKPGAKVIMMAAASLNSPYKGTFYAVEALQRLSGGEPRGDYHLLLLGESGGALAEALNGRYTVTSAHVSNDDDLARAFRASDLTLVPSVAENFPYAVLESFACSRPVVCFRVGGLPEMVGENARGILVQPFETDTMAHEIRQLLNDDQRRALLGESARAWAERHAGFDSYLQSMAAIYHQCAAMKETAGKKVTCH